MTLTFPNVRLPTVESVIPAYGVRIMRDDTHVSDWFAFDVPDRTFTI